MPKLFFLPLPFILLLATGCASTEPGQDPLVVHAERTTAIALDVMDAFLRIEHEHRALLDQAVPEIHRFAERLRRDGPQYLATARAATRAYKHSRSPENQFTLQTALAVLQTALTEAQRYIALIERQPLAGNK
jgi:hypothetical protein